ncbi:FIG00552529: hypothetical protein [hydrothermal vent metagenome]|jgi:hypothetical protein|uniref:Uncharacterized protein n=1 Tax=hydrothermal vent metagenome TaxID=652676 RepID=A0A3B0R0G6_9ZZZZ
MKIKCIFTLITLFIVTSTFSQINLNDYKYVIVPNKFDFLKSNNQYQLNSLTKFLFKKYGFTVLMEEDAYPVDLASNYCLALKSNVLESGGMFKTKLKIELRNCNNEIVFTSDIGETREKEFKKAYALALRSAFKSFETLSYNYQPNKSVIAKSKKTNKSSTQEIEKLKEEIKTLKNENSSTAIVVTSIKKEKPKADEISEVKTQESQPIKASNVLYAQEIDNGFQIVNSTPKIVMILLTTPLQNIFIVRGRDAIVYKEDGFWFISENKDNSTTTKTLEIKF